MSGGNDKRIPIDLLDVMPNGRYLPYIWRLDLLLLKVSAGSDHRSSSQDVVVADSALAAVTVTDEARHLTGSRVTIQVARSVYL